MKEGIHPEYKEHVEVSRRYEPNHRRGRVSLGSRAGRSDGMESGRLIFEGETLAEAVAEFNRYNEVQIVLQDSRLSEERLSGVFDADQPQALVRFLERSGVVEPARSVGESILLVPQR